MLKKLIYYVPGREDKKLSTWSTGSIVFPGGRRRSCQWDLLCSREGGEEADNGIYCVPGREAKRFMQLLACDHQFLETTI